MMTLANEVVQALSEILDFSDLAEQNRSDQEKLIHDAILTLSEQRKMHLNGREVADLVKAVLADMLGLGPLESLLADEAVTDIMVNGPFQVYVERGGNLELTGVRFRNNAHVFAVASRIVTAVGRRIDESQPMVDARLKDGSRVNVAVPPLAIDGPTITIRKFPTNPVKLEALVAGLAGDAITLQDLFTFETAPSSTRTSVTGAFRYTGFQPKFASRAADYGVADELNAILGAAS
jgi:pilus assembly protein CpaF